MHFLCSGRGKGFDTQAFLFLMLVLDHVPSSSGGGGSHTLRRSMGGAGGSVILRCCTTQGTVGKATREFSQI